MPTPDQPTASDREADLQRICEDVRDEREMCEVPALFIDFAKEVARRYAATVGAGVPEERQPHGPWQVSDLDRLWGGMHDTRKAAATAAFNLAALHPGNTILVYEAVASFKAPPSPEPSPSEQE